MLSHAVLGPRDGPTVVLLHGFPLDRLMWRMQLGPLTGAGYRVVAIDLPGFGHGGAPLAGDEPEESIDAMALRVQTLLGHLRIAKCIVVGFSMGGYVALALAASSPDKLQGLVLCDTRSEPDSEEARAKRDATIADVRVYGVRVVAQAMLPNLLTAQTRTQRALLADEVRTMMMRQPKKSVLAALAALRDRKDRRPGLPHIACPTLVVVGEEDKVTPREAAQVMADGITGAKIEVIAKAAHLVPMERADEFNAALLGWLQAHFPVKS